MLTYKDLSALDVIEVMRTVLPLTEKFHPDIVFAGLITAALICLAPDIPSDRLNTLTREVSEFVQLTVNLSSEVH